MPPKVISKSFIAEVSMSDVLRPYRDLFPQIGQRVMIDDSSVVIGDVRLADDVGDLAARCDSWRCTLCTDRSTHQYPRMAVCCMSLINPRTTQMATH